jgi:hypothetical protein
MRKKLRRQEELHRLMDQNNAVNLSKIAYLTGA